MLNRRLMPHGMDDQGARELLLAPVRCQASWEDAAESATRAAGRLSPPPVWR